MEKEKLVQFNKYLKSEDAMGCPCPDTCICDDEEDEEI